MKEIKKEIFSCKMLISRVCSKKRWGGGGLAKPFLERKSLISSLQKNINRIRGKGQKAYEYLADRFKQ